MHLLFGDETNTEPDQGDFFIYGGLILSADQAVSVHQSVAALRDEYELELRHKVKFAPQPRPEHLSPNEWIELKAKVLAALVDVEASFLAYCVLHTITRDRSPQQRNQWAIEAVLYRSRPTYNEPMITGSSYSTSLRSIVLSSPGSTPSASCSTAR